MNMVFFKITFCTLFCACVFQTSINVCLIHVRMEEHVKIISMLTIVPVQWDLMGHFVKQVCKISGIHGQ